MRVLYILYVGFGGQLNYGVAWGCLRDGMQIGIGPSDCEWIVPGTIDET